MLYRRGGEARAGHPARRSNAHNPTDPHTSPGRLPSLSSSNRRSARWSVAIGSRAAPPRPDGGADHHPRHGCPKVHWSSRRAPPCGGSTSAQGQVGGHLAGLQRWDAALRLQAGPLCRNTASAGTSRALSRQPLGSTTGDRLKAECTGSSDMSVASSDSYNSSGNLSGYPTLFLQAGRPVVEEHGVGGHVQSSISTTTWIDDCRPIASES